MSALLALAILVQAPAADTLQVRQGLYLGVGIGPAIAALSCAECDPGTETAFTGRLEAGIGVALSPHLTAGLHLEGWNNPDGAGGVLGKSLVVSWYPKPGGGTFIRPSIGIASFTGEEVGDGPDEEGSGPLVGLTLGQDLRFDKKLSLTPTLFFRYADIGSTSMATTPIRSDVSTWTVGIGFGLTWH